MGPSQQEDGSELPFPPEGDLPDAGIEPVSPVSPTLAGRFFTTEPTKIPAELVFKFFFNLNFKISSNIWLPPWTMQL